MNREKLKALLTGLRRGEVSVASALKSLKHWPVEELPFAALDHHRGLRQGCPEVIFCEGKEAKQVAEIAARMFEAGENILATRATPEVYQAVRELLNNVRLTGDWEAWLDFFADAVILTATQAVEAARQLLDLSKNDQDKISGLGRAAASSLQVHRALMEHPIATSGSLVVKTGFTPATVNKALAHLEQLGIVRELTARKRNRLFSYTNYIEIINIGTELPGS